MAPFRAHRFGTVLGVAFGVTLAPGVGLASSPLEFPDNGAASFGRGGAWLATASDPIAAHYNPAMLATQPGGFSVSALASYNRVCFDRRNPGSARTGPRQGRSADVDRSLQYREACNDPSGFPNVVPSLAFAMRVSDELGIGVALVPPAAYGTGIDEWPAFSRGYNARTGESQTVPAPYRFMTVGNQSKILFRG